MNEFHKIMNYFMIKGMTGQYCKQYGYMSGIYSIVSAIFPYIFTLNNIICYNCYKCIKSVREPLFPNRSLPCANGH